MAKGKSYNVGVDNFTGGRVCRECPKINNVGLCSVYPPDGMIFRATIGHCPVVNRWADWRTDKPTVNTTKARIGQGKTKSGGNN